MTWVDPAIERSTLTPGPPSLTRLGTGQHVNQAGWPIPGSSLGVPKQEASPLLLPEGWLLPCMVDTAVSVGMGA